MKNLRNMGSWRLLWEDVMRWTAISGGSASRLLWMGWWAGRVRCRG
jgi:hypothetical protein